MNTIKLEQLAPYLPYDLTHHMVFEGQVMIGDIDTYNVMNFVNGMTNSKPVMLPVSNVDLAFFQRNIDEDIEDFRINCEPEKNHFSVEVCDKVIGWTALAYEEYQFFFKERIDVFGLIDAGLAIDVNTLKTE